MHVLLTGEFAQITGQELATRKTKAHGPMPQKIELLYVKSVLRDTFFKFLRCAKPGGSHVFQHTRHKRCHSHCPKCLSSSDRGHICVTAIIPKVLFASEISVPSFAEIGKLRSSIARAVWKKRSSRSADVVLSLLHPVHRVDPKCAWAYLCLNHLRRMSLRRPEIVEIMRKIWLADSPKINFGRISALKQALKFIGWGWSEFEQFERPGQRPLAWLQNSLCHFQHDVRDALRISNLSVANKRLDLRGVGEKPVALNKILRRLNNYQKGTYEAILAGGLRSAQQFCKSGLATDPACPFCGHTEEDVQHIFLTCPAWAPIRLKFPEISLDWLTQADPCTRICAVPIIPDEVA